ncbi:unnamed protein product [Closterium sp. NIES-53]
MENLMYKDSKAENEAKIGMRFGEVKSSGLEHVELPLELSSSSTTTRQSSLVNGGEEAKNAEEEEEEVQQVSECAPTLPSRTTSAPRIRVTPQQRQGLHVPAAEEEGRGKRRIQAPNRLTHDALGKPAKSALAGVALIVGDDKESDYEECAFAFFSPVEMPGEPATLKEALESSDAEDWKNAMESELKSIEENGTWKLVELPEGRKAITSKWLFKIKSDADGKIERYKSRLVAKGYQQKEKVDYKELFAPVEIGFTPSSADHSLFMLGEGEQRSFMVVYVDDILIFSPSSDLVKEVMLKLQDKFKCKALGDVSFYLGLHIERDVEKRCMRVHQRKYLEALAANFGQSEGHVATPFPSGFKCVKGPEEESVGEEERRRFHSLVGSLMYAAVNTQLDVAFATGQLARVVQCPNEEQVAAGMRVAKYLDQTTTVGLQYSAAAQRRQKGADSVEPGHLFLTAFSDASFASEPEDMTSVGGFICCVGGGPTAWESKKQVDQALSSVESEYMALFRAVREIVWQRRLLDELGEEQQGPTPLYCDSHGAISLAKNPVLHGLTKHMRGSLHEEIWLRRPPGFTGSFPAGTQWSLRWPVYGLHEAPREWHDTLRTTLAALGFAPLTANPSLYLHTDTSLPPFYVLVYVLQYFGFWYSSPQSSPLPTGHSLSAPPSDESLEPSGAYLELVGCLMYLMTCTRPELAYPLSILSCYVAPGRHLPEHWEAAKRVLRYLCSTSGIGLGYTFSLGSGFVSWRSTRSSSVISSSCEAEIYAGAMAAQELCWLTYLLTSLGEWPCSSPVLYVDNKAMIALCYEHRLEHRTKHITLRYFLAQELQQGGQLRLAYVATRANNADIFTKALQSGDHQHFCTVLGLVPTLPHLLTA